MTYIYVMLNQKKVGDNANLKRIPLIVHARTVESRLGCLVLPMKVFNT